MLSASPGEQSAERRAAVWGANVSAGDCQHRFTRAESRLIAPLTKVQECGVELEEEDGDQLTPEVLAPEEEPEAASGGGLWSLQLILPVPTFTSTSKTKGPKKRQRGR